MAIPNIDDSYPVAPLENLFNLIGDGAEADILALQNAIATKLQRAFFLWANAAARTAQTGMVNGDSGYQLDTASNYVRVSGAWVRSAKSYIWADATARSGQTGMAEGDTGDQADTDQRWRYNGTVWVDTSGAFCSLSKTANQNLSTSLTALTWDIELSDTSGMHDNITNSTRIVLPRAGIWEVTAQMYNNNTAGTGVVQARRNGTTDVPGSFTRRDGTGTAAIPLATTFPVSAAANDYIEIMVSHSTAAGAITGGAAVASAAVVTVKYMGPA